MNKLTLAAIFITFAVCNFCGNDFISVNRHKWRCKSKNAREEEHTSRNRENSANTNITHRNVVANCESVHCVCGKKCRNIHGLKMHLRSCRIARGINETGENIENGDPTELSEETVDDILIDPGGSPILKQAVKLPKSEADWDLANTYFKATLPCDQIPGNNLDDTIKTFYNIVYEYFKNTCGTVNANQEMNNLFQNKYKDSTKNQLKKILKELKSSQDKNVNEIKFVSRLLRNNIRKPNQYSIDSADHDSEISCSFWNYCKKHIIREEKISPTFNMKTCYDYFKKTVSCLNPLKRFTIPGWIPKLNKPNICFDNTPPTYRELCKAIKRTKASGSPCPLDKISIICFKRSPYLRSFLLEIIREIWLKREIPTVWKKAVTILIHKKGNTQDPSNFRPITLETVPLKIFTSLLRDKMYNFLLANGYIENSIQKGFVPKMSGTFEHISHLGYTINHARRKQKSLTITLIDLRNAFGEVNHNLIEAVLDFHHIPGDIRELIRTLYKNFNIALATENYVTDYINVKKGVLQGDSASPLIFNLIINTFILYVKENQYSQLGYTFEKGFLPRNWYQFADDAIAVTPTERENQLLLDAFSRWCNWSHMSIRTDKCHSFGMKKVNSTSKQILPKVYLNNKLVSPIKIGESFSYLGRYFDFKMSNAEHKQILKEMFNKYINIIDKLPLHPKHKISLYMRFLLSKISWHLTVADITETWVKENIDNILCNRLRIWLEIPISGTLSIIKLTKRKHGLGIITVSAKYTQCQVTFRNSLRNSPNDDIRKIFFATNKASNIRYDNYKSTTEVIKSLRLSETEKISKLTTQKLVISAMWENLDKSLNTFWTNALYKMPKNIYNFTIRYINNTLANGTNMYKWKIANSPDCLFCQQRQTLLHVVAGCQVFLNEGRFDWRHNSILQSLLNCIPRGPDIKLYGDIPGYSSPSIITGDDYRPDALFIKDNKVWVLELSIGFETNVTRNINRKALRYHALIANLAEGNYAAVKFINLSMGAIGGYGKGSGIKTFLKDFGVGDTETKYELTKMSNICMRCSYYIFCLRNRKWTNPELLNL